MGSRLIFAAPILAQIHPFGKVLVAGGWDGTNIFASVELFDTVSGTWTTTSHPLNEGRVHFTATILTNGQVLPAGGMTNSGYTANVYEVYDPVAGTWSNGVEPEGRYHNTATRFYNG